MRVLMLTWEFPPVITGGLGMACYGMAKALLRQGTELDLVMPAKEPAYFPLRRTEDADNLPVAFVDLSKQQKLRAQRFKENLREFIGAPLSVYYTTGQTMQSSYSFGCLQQSEPFDYLFEVLADEYYLLRQVKHYTAMAVDIGSRLCFDVIHAHDWLAYPAGMILKRLSGRPLVVHVHATEFDRAGGAGDKRIHDIEYMGMRYADKAITVSGYTADTITGKYNVSIDKTRVVHNAYSVSDSKSNYKRIFKEPTILFMGRITLQKGPDYFLELARRVLQQEKKIRFIMAGSGDMEKQVLYRAASLGLGTKFLVAGFLDRQEVENVLSSTDIFVLPSVSEPFGIAPLEAMSHGAVAIVSKSSGVAEVIDSAYKVDFWDINRMVTIIVELVRNPAKFKEMSRRGKEEVTNLQWEEAGRKIMDVFCELETVR